eukprot:1909938-Prymnesium_polylepis.1
MPCRYRCRSPGKAIFSRRPALLAGGEADRCRATPRPRWRGVRSPLILTRRGRRPQHRCSPSALIGTIHSCSAGTVPAL